MSKPNLSVSQLKNVMVALNNKEDDNSNTAWLAAFDLLVDKIGAESVYEFMDKNGL